MNRKLTTAFVMLILICVFLTSIKQNSYTNLTAFGQVGTSVGGIIWNNTTWTVANSPYIITDTVQIPASVTLTIEPGVTVISYRNGQRIFYLEGNLIAHGNVNKISFDGEFYGSVLFTVTGLTNNAFIDLDYCIIRNVGCFYTVDGNSGGYGYFYLRHSELTNIAQRSQIWYPKNDIYIEYNTFTNCSGFSIGQSNANVYIRYNLFNGWNPSSGYFQYLVNNWASYGTSKTMVNYNSFVNMNNIVVKLDPGYSSAAMDAANNYWGTNNLTRIASMIYDKNDDISCAGFINYLPILSEPYPTTPVIAEFPSTPFLTLMMLLILAATLVFRKKLLKSQ